MSGFQGFGQVRAYEIRVHRGWAQAQRGQEARLRKDAAFQGFRVLAKSGRMKSGSTGDGLRPSAARKLGCARMQHVRVSGF